MSWLTAGVAALVILGVAGFIYLVILAQEFNH